MQHCQSKPWVHINFFCTPKLHWSERLSNIFILLSWFFSFILFCVNSNNFLSNLRHKRKKLSLTIRAVKKFLSSRVIMNSKRLWNSHSMHKFLRAKELIYKDILKIRVSEMVLPGVFKRFFPPRKPCCFIRTNARLGTMLS